MRILKYASDFQLEQLTAVQDVMDAYAAFATEIGQAEFDSMRKLGLKAPHLSESSKQLPSALLKAGPTLSLPLNDKE